MGGREVRTREAVGWPQQKSNLTKTTRVGTTEVVFLLCQHGDQSGGEVGALREPGQSRDKREGLGKGIEYHRMDRHGN